MAFALYGHLVDIHVGHGMCNTWAVLLRSSFLRMATVLLSSTMATSGSWKRPAAVYVGEGPIDKLFGEGHSFLGLDNFYTEAVHRNEAKNFSGKVRFFQCDDLFLNFLFLKKKKQTHVCFPLKSYFLDRSRPLRTKR